MFGPAKRFQVLAGLCGVVGPIILVGSFMLNPAPPGGLGPVALAAWAARHEDLLAFGGWTQGIGSVLIVIFALAVAELGRQASPFAARLTMLAGAVILMVSLTEVSLYLAAAQAAATRDASLGLVSAGLIKAVQHVFLIAPALLLPLGFVILQSRVLPAFLGYSGLVIGASLQALGLIGIFGGLQPVIDIVLIVQSFWFIVAGVLMALSARTPPISALGSASPG